MDSVTCLCIVAGTSQPDELRYLKSASVQLWLFGYELPGAPRKPQAR